MRRGSIVAIAWAAACAASGPSPSDDPGERVEAASLQFVAPAEAGAFETARACFAARGDAWRHEPLQRIGNFVEEAWCTGPGSEHGCSGGTFRERGGAQWADVGALHYPQQWPQVFGTIVSVGRIAADDGWSVSASVSSGGQSILGDGAHVSLWHGEDREHAIHLGTVYSHEIAQDTIMLDPPGEPWDVFERLRASPTSLRDEGVARLQALRAEVVRRLEAGEVLECVYGPYEGGGVPPQCLEKVALTPEKVAAETARIDAQTDAAVQALQRDHVAMHAALVAIAAPDCIARPGA